MKRAFFATVAAAALLAGAAEGADAPLRPDPQLTPGAVASTDMTLICQPGYARSVRHTSGKLKAQIYREYQIDRRHGHYEIDHLIPLSLGGADAGENLWPESFDTQPWNATVKDRLEVFFHAEVCAGRIPIGKAQAEIAGDWIAAYKRYLGDP
jgi:hypothetical protein